MTMPKPPILLNRIDPSYLSTQVSLSMSLYCTPCSCSCSCSCCCPCSCSRSFCSLILINLLLHLLFLLLSLIFICTLMSIFPPSNVGIISRIFPSTPCTFLVPPFSLSTRLHLSMYNTISYTYSQEHFADLMRRYGSPVIVLDLVKQSERLAYSVDVM